MDLTILKRLIPIGTAHAHCDIPCGIYDPVAAKIAAQTVLKMVMRIQGLDHPSGGSSDQQAAYHNSMDRYISVKEHIIENI